MTIIRLATEQDIAAMLHIFYLNEIRDVVDPPPPPADIPVLYQHIVQHDAMYVAEQDGRVSGYAGTIRRGTVAYLSDLFVHPEMQSSHLGKTLLQHALPPVDQFTRCMMSSTDHRAL